VSVNLCENQVCMMIVSLLVSQILTSLADGYILRSGFCKENVRGIPDFEKDRYLGAWYEYANTFEVYEFGAKCVRATYTDEGDRVGVFNEQVSTISGNYGNIKGSARFANPDDPQKRAELIVGFGGFGRKKRSPQVPFIQSYWVPTIYSTAHMYPVESPNKGRFLLPDSNEPNYSVIHTDYDTYSVVYTCIPLPARVKKESLWLLTREQFPAAATVAKGIEIMKEYDLPYNNIPLTSHEDCALLPPVGEGVPMNTIESLGR